MMMTVDDDDNDDDDDDDDEGKISSIPLPGRRAEANNQFLQETLKITKVF